MRYARSKVSAEQPDLLHNAMMASHLGMQPLMTAAIDYDEEDDQIGFSELSLNGSPRHCLQLLAPVLRDLSQADLPGWLSLIDPPLPISQKWLRASGLDPQRILIIRSRHGMDSLKLCCDILELGYSHTVVSWLPTSAHSRLLDKAAQAGHCASLNIRMGSQPRG
ncbi:MAG: SOS-induced cell division inhibitor SulA [Pseudomonas sp.]